MTYMPTPLDPSRNWYYNLQLVQADQTALANRVAVLEAGAPVPTPAPVVVASPAYFDDMSVDGAVSGRANWVAGPNPANFTVSGGAAHNTVLYGPTTGGSFGPSQGDTFRATFGYDTTSRDDSYVAGHAAYYLWESADGNVSITIDKQNSRLTVSSTYQNAAGPHAYYNLPWNTKGTIMVEARAGKLNFMVDGKWLETGASFSYPYGELDMSSLGNKTGPIGVTQDTFRFPILDYISVDSVGFAIDHIDEFVGRDSLLAVGGKAKLAGTLAAGANPTRWVARLLSPKSLEPVVDWADMTTVSVTSQTMTGFVFLPTGGPYIVQAGYVDGSDGKARVALSKETTSGIRGEVYGQSNALYRNNASSDTKAIRVATSGAGAIDPLGTWATSANGIASNTMVTAAKEISALIGKPVGIGAQGVGGVPIETLIPANTDGSATPGWTLLTGNMAARRGVVEFLLWDQGEGNADGDYAPTTYADTFRTKLLPGLRTLMGNPHLKVFISPVGRYAGDLSGNNNAAANLRIDSQREVLRQQYLTIIAAEPDVRFADSKLGCVHVDPYHYVADMTGYGEMARRAGYTIAKALGAEVADGRGALPVSAARNGAVIDVAVDLNGGNGLSGPLNINTGTVPTPGLQGLMGFQVSADNFVTTLAISSVALNGNAIRITLAADPGAAVQVRSHYGFSYDDTSVFTTTYADGRTAIPVFPIMAPISAG